MGRAGAAVGVRQLRRNVSAQDVMRVRARLTMSECYKRPKCVKYQARANQAVDVQFSEVLDCCYPLLVRAVYVLLQPPACVFEHLIYNGYGECRVIAL